MITKEKLKEHIEKFPDSFSIEELIEHLIFVDKLEKRIQLSESGEIISDEDLKSEIRSYLSESRNS